MKFSLLKKMQNNVALDDAELSELVPFYKYFTRTGNVEYLRRILALEPDKKMREYMLRESFIVAAQYGQINLLKDLHLASPKENVTKLIRMDNYHAIREAATYGQVEVVNLLTEQLAEPILRKVISGLPVGWQEKGALSINDYPLNIDSPVESGSNSGVLNQPTALSSDADYDIPPERFREFLGLMLLRSRMRSQQSDIIKRTKNMAVMFENIEQADTYLTACRGKPSHIFFLYELPKTHDWDISKWRTLMMKHGVAVSHYLCFAPQLEKALSIADPGRSIEELSLDEIETLAVDSIYKNGNVNPQLTKIALRLNLQQEQLDAALEVLTTNALPSEDKTPNADIKGEDIGCSGYHLRKVVKGDPLNLWIGKFPKIRNCNWLGDFDGQEMAKAQCFWGDVSLYVVENEQGNPVAKISGWVKDGAFVLNSWQSFGRKYLHLKAPFVMELARQAIENKDGLNIDRVIVGVGSRTAEGKNFGNWDANVARFSGFKPVAVPVDIGVGEHNMCEQDCQVQLLVGQRSMLSSLKQRLAAVVQATTAGNLERVASSTASQHRALG